MMPMSIVGGSYRKVNPQLRQIVTSLNEINKSLSRAPDYWWVGKNDSPTLKDDPTLHVLDEIRKFDQHEGGNLRMEAK